MEYLEREIKMQRQLHEAAYKEARAILDKAERENRGLTAAEKVQYKELEADIDAAAEGVKDLEERKANPPDYSNLIKPEGSSRVTRDTVTLTKEQRMSDWVEKRQGAYNGEPLNFTKWLKGVSTGDWVGAEAERRSLAEATGGAGGFMVPAPLSGMIIDRARNIARVFQAGAQTVPMESQTLRIARVAGDPTAAWHTENATVAQSDMTLESVTLTARTLASLTTASRELLEDANNVQDVLLEAFAKQLALTLDKAALYGSGIAPEPTGIKLATGVSLQSMGANGAAPTNFDWLVDAVTTCRNNNEEPNAVIDAPRTESELAKLKDSQLRYLDPPAMLENLPRYPTNQVPTNLTVGSGTTTSDAFVGDFTELLIGIRTGFMVQVLNERYMDQLMYGYVATLRADCIPARPKAFTVVSGIL